MAEFDLAIIGGGIVGTALARDAAGRGLSVLLVEQNDLASGTSSTTSKLIHGGLRYVEQGMLALVREGLLERARLLKAAPHIIWPARFVLPHHKGLRPAWQLRFGLFIYDLLGIGGNKLPFSCAVNLKTDQAGDVLQTQYTQGFEYSDACVDDARLVVLNALDAAERGASIRPRTVFLGAARGNGVWHINLQGKAGKEHVHARALINAAGPWVEKVGAVMPKDAPRSGVKLVKGSHIVVRSLFAHKKPYIFQNADGRIVFAIPYRDDFTLIGTTDVKVEGDPSAVTASKEEIAYLCKLANDYFRKQITPADVVWSFAGLRALYDNRSLNAKDLSRDYLLELDAGRDKAPLLSIYGGKLTAARHLAERAMAKLKPFLKLGPAWTGKAPLPGGDFAWNGMDALIENARATYPFLSPAHAARLARAYGTRIDGILGRATTKEQLGQHFGGDLYEAEVRYLMKNEWAMEADDILWRRGKFGLTLDAPQQQNLAAFMKEKA